MLLGTQKANGQRDGVTKGVSAQKIQELQAEAETYFNEQKYLQSVKVAAQIAASCGSKEYTAEIVAKFNQVCVTDLIVKSKFKNAAQILKEVLQLVQEHLLKENEENDDNMNSAEYENLRRLTLNNLGCALKKCGLVEEAEQYFSQISTQDPLYELNLCAVQNKKQNHRQALIHAQQAATLLETELNELRVTKETQGPDSSTEKDYFLERTSLLAIAYYNQGCELENLDNLIRATQAFSRAVNLISGSQANQQLLSQLKLSLKQARYKLKQQMLPTSQNNQKIQYEKNAAIPPKPTKDPKTQTFEYLGKIEGKASNSFDYGERPYSAVNLINHVHFAQKSSPGQNNSKVQTPLRNEKGSEVTKGYDKSNADKHELLSQNSQLSNSKKDAFVDQMILRPTVSQDQKIKQRGAHQASQSGSRSNSLRQKQAKLQLSQANLGTFIPAGMHLPRVVPPVNHRRNSSAQANKSLPKHQTIESIALPKLDQHKLQSSGSTKNLLDGKGSLGFGGQTLFAAKATFVQNSQQQSLPKVTESTKPPIKKVASTTQVKQVPVTKVIDPKLEQQKMEKCAKLIQSYIKRRRFRKIVHAMIIRRKIQQGKLKHQDLTKIEKETLQRLQQLDKKMQAAQLNRNTSETHLNAVKMIQRLFRVKKFRATIQAVIAAKRELEKNGLREYLQNAQKDAFIEIVLGKANSIRKQKAEEGTVNKAKLNKAVAMVQSWYRRRKFRRAVTAMILLRKIKLGQVKVTQLNKIDKLTYDSILKVNKQLKSQEKQAQELQKKEKYARMIQSLFRRHRFRSIVNCVVEIQRKARANSGSKQITKQSVSAKQRQATLEKAMQLRQKEIEQKKEERRKLKKAVKFIQSWVRRRKFRKIVEATIILRKFWQGKVGASALTSIDPKLRDNILKAHRTQSIQTKKELAFEAKKLKAIRLIQRYVRRRKFRQLVMTMVQVTKNGSMQKHLNKQKVLKGSNLNQFDERMRFINQQRQVENQKSIEWRAKEKKAGKMIKALVQRYRFRKLIKHMILLRQYQNGDLSKKAQVKSIPLSVKLQLALIAKVKKELAKQRIREETCARMIQSLFRRRRFRKAVEAMMVVAKRIREQNSKSKYKSHQYELSHKQRLEEAKLVRKQMIQQEAKWRAKQKAAAKLIQGYIRRRNFRRLIQAIVLQNRIKAGKASPKEYQQLSTYIRKNLEYSEKKRKILEKEQGKSIRAAKLIQSWYRRRKFRKIVEAVIFLKRMNNPIDGKYKSKKIGVKSSFDETIQQANQIRKQKQSEEIEYRRNLLKAVKMVQRWFRRNKFRKLVFAMIVKKKVQAKKLPPSALKDFSKQTLEALEKADKKLKDAQIKLNQQNKASKVIQRWYRALRFRRGFQAFVKARVELGSVWKSSLKQSGMAEVYFNRVEIKARFIRNKMVKEELQYRQKLRKAARMVQSYYRRRQFRKLVQAMIQLRKQTTSKSKASFLSKLQAGMRKRLDNILKMQQTLKQAQTTAAPKQLTQPVSKEPVMINQTTTLQQPASNVFNHTMISSFTAPTQNKVQSHHINNLVDDKRSNARSSIGFQGQKRSTHSQSSVLEQTPLAETSDLQSSQKIVIDYWYNGLQVAFQPGFAKKKPILMVSLILNQQTQDRKILSLDLYQLALDAGALDLKHFCDKQIMPCLQIKEKNGQFKLKLLHELIQELVKKTGPSQNLLSQFLNPAQQSSKLTPNKKLTGMLPLIKKQIVLNYKVYTVQAICDFDIQMMKLTAEREDQYLFINVQVDMSQPQSDLLKSLCSHAEDLVHSLMIIDGELKLRKAAVPTLHDEEVIYRSGKVMEGRFYLVNIGIQSGKTTIEALDKERELRLVLQLGSQGGKAALNENAIGEILEKLDTHNLGGEKILVIR